MNSLKVLLLIIFIDTREMVFLWSY